MKKAIESVLLIEDNAGDARLIREMFNEPGLRGILLTHVECMRDAQAHLADHVVDIILLDLGLPDAQGLEAVDRARAMAPSTSLVVLTGLDDETLATRTLREGAQDYLIKGEIESRGLYRALRYAIERKICEGRYRGLLEAAPDAMVVIDQAGEIVLLNLQAEKQFGYFRNELVGQKVTNIIPRGFAERLIVDGLRSAEEALAQQIGMGLELTARRKNGSEFPIELMLSPLEGVDGKLVTAAIRNIAPRRELEQQLRQTQKMEAVGQLTAGIAHDFNNLLTVITCTIECLAAAVAGDPELAAMAKGIDDAAERGTQLTQRMLAFARKQPLHPRAIDLNEVATHMVVMLRRMLGEDIDLQTKLGDELWSATADGNQVEDAILNLAINARDAMPKGGSLVIETDNVYLNQRYAAQNAEVTPGDYVSIAVTDSGTGMSADVMERAFEPFFTTKEVGYGTGLGLSMVYGFAKQSRGHVKIYSALGHGTTIKLFLPRATSGPAAQIVAKPNIPEQGGTETILVVEDDPLVRGAVLTMLRGFGYCVREAANARAALEILNHGDHIDLLFTDIVMPGGMNGWDLVEAARLSRPALKVLFASGYYRVFKDSLHVGTDVPLLTKPYRARSLGEAIRAVLSEDALPLSQRQAS